MTKLQEINKQIKTLEHEARKLDALATKLWRPLAILEGAFYTANNLFCWPKSKKLIRALAIIKNSDLTDINKFAKLHDEITKITDQGEKIQNLIYKLKEKRRKAQCICPVHHKICT